jgi:hypothetical protein
MRSSEHSAPAEDVCIEVIELTAELSPPFDVACDGWDGVGEVRI